MSSFKRICSYSYYLAFALYCIRATLTRTTFVSVFSLDVNHVDFIIQIIICFLIFFSILEIRYKLYELIIYAVLICISLYIWNRSGEALFFWIFLFMLGAKNKSINVYATISMLVSLFFVIICPLAATFNVIENVSIAADANRQARFAFGFNHPNTFGNEILIITLSFVVINFYRKNILSYCITLLGIFFTTIISDSRTSVICMLILLVLLFVFQNFKKPDNLRIACIVAYLFICCFSIYCMVFFNYSNSILAKINSILSNRLVLSNIYYNIMKPSLWGNNYNGIGVWRFSDFTVDNAYCHIILSSGIILSTIFLILFLLAFMKCISIGYNGVILFGLIVFVFCGITEVNALRIEENYFILSIASVIACQKISSLDPHFKDCYDKIS